MRNRIIVTSIFIITTCLSCSKVLDKEPTHLLDGSDRFKSLDDYQSALIGAYSLFQQLNYYGAGSNAYVGLPDLLSDNFDESGESLGNFTTLTTWRYAEDETNIDGTWIAAYRIIAQANVVLRGIDRFATDDPGRYNRIKGQALAIRAMVHFDILRYWANDFDRNSDQPGIPYISSFDPENKPPRGTVKETYDHIESDLLEARSLLQNTDVVINETGRAFMDDLVVEGILARVYLYAKEYDKAIEQASKMIDAFPLADKVEFPKIWTDLSSAELIWSVAFNLGEGRIGDNIYFVPNDRSSYAPNETLLNQYDWNNDIRVESYFREINGRIVFSKYLSKAALQNRPDGVVDFKAIRSAEMYLIRAESPALTGREAEALDDLNALREARINNFVPGTETGNDLIDAIALERRKELIGEGHRWFDIKRTTRFIARPDCVNFCVLEPNDRAWAWPIPIVEINANPNIGPQNPGY
jgi:starch-binding outer membrane protein, SusD/RagB family